MEAKIKVYGSHTCVDTLRSRRFLREHKIPFIWVDVDEDEEGLNLIKSVNNGRRTTPTIFLEDGSVLFEPSDKELAARLGL
ncbi:MAG: NrdH-redoxin, partial [SAR202 cluster bacterium]|nr:NrdH-redoxin [SAR202 cluster bacterium]